MTGRAISRTSSSPSSGDRCESFIAGPSSLYLRRVSSPTEGYKLAADFCQNYDPRHGNSLNGPSRTKIMEIVRFMFTLEALEEDDGR